MSGYQMFLFLFCYYGYMGVATAVAGNIFYQYRSRISIKASNTTLIVDSAKADKKSVLKNKLHLRGVRGSKE